jgi:hypothetical protein
VITRTSRSLLAGGLHESVGHYRGRPEKPMRSGHSTPLVRHRYTLRKSPPADALTATAAAALLGHSASTVRYWITLGWIAAGWAITTGHHGGSRHYVVDPEALRDFAADPRAFPYLDPAKIRDRHLRERAIEARAAGEWLTPVAAAERFGYSPWALHHLAAAGRIRSLRFRNAHKAVYHAGDIARHAEKGGIVPSLNPEGRTCAARACEWCDGEYLPYHRNQRFCSPACAREDKLAESRTGDVIRALLDTTGGRSTSMPAEVIRDAGGRPVAKRCACGQTFPVEYQARGQMTSRALCDDCRVRGSRLTSADLCPPPGTPRCRDCGAVGEYAGGLDSDGLCPACAAWREKAAARAARLAAGQRLVGGIGVGR